MITTSTYNEAAEKMRPRLLKIAAAFVSDYDAEDVVQETLSYCYEHLAEYDPEQAELFTWVTRKLRMMAIDMVRRDERARRWAEAEPEGFDPLEEDTGEYRRAQAKPRLDKPEPSYEPGYVERTDVRNALASLDERVRLLVIGSVVQGYTNAELGEKYGVSAQWAGKVVQQGIAKMRKYLERGLKRIELKIALAA